MPTPATLQYVADIVVRRAVIEASSHGRPLQDVLAEFYPFSEDEFCRRVWDEALRRNGVKVPEPTRKAAAAEVPKRQARGCSA